MDDDFLPVAPPSNLEAELAVLGAIALDGRRVAEIRTLLEPTDFYHQKNRIIYEAALALSDRGEPVDVLTLFDEIGTKADITGADITRIQGYCIAPENAAHHAKAIAAAAMRRRLIEAGHRIVASAHDVQEDEALIGEALGIVQSVSRSAGGKWVSFDESSVAAWKTVMGHMTGSAKPGAPLGFQPFDHLTGGFRPGQLGIIGARTSVGKTALALQAAVATAEQGRTVALFSLEMLPEELALRVASRFTARNGLPPVPMRVTQGRYALEEFAKASGTDPDDALKRFQRGLEYARELPILVNPQAAIKPAEVRSQVECVIAQHGNVGLVILDHMQLMRVARSRGLREDMTAISAALKATAQTTGVPVVALSQLSRTSEHEGRPPRLHDLRESGSLEQDADVVLLLHRTEQGVNGARGFLNLAKNRQGPAGPGFGWHWEFHGQLGVFRHVEPNQKGDER